MKKAVFTAVKQDVYLETWLKYYSRFFEDIYVINTDPGTPDEIIMKAKEKYKFTVITDYPNPSYLMEIDRGQVKEFQKKLLEKYDWVVFAHADEFIVPDPAKYKDLSDYIDKCTKDYVFCSGYNVLQMWEEKDGEPNEPMLDLSKPILPQRKYWWYEFGYNKPLISRVPLNWSLGFHKVDEISDSDLHNARDVNLYLFHLKQADFNIFGKRIAGQPSNGKGYEWFYKEHDKRELIPERLKIF